MIINPFLFGSWWVNGVTVIPELTEMVITTSFTNTPNGVIPSDSYPDTTTMVLTPSFTNDDSAGIFKDGFPGNTLGATWVWANQLSSTAVVNNGLTLTKAGAAGLSLLLQPLSYAGSGGFTITGAFGTAGVSNQGMCLYNSTTGRIVLFSMAGGPAIYITRWTNFSTYSSTDYGVATTLSQKYLRMVITNMGIVFQTSTDCTAWVNYYTNASAIMTWLGSFSHVGFALDTGSLTSPLFKIS